VPDTYSRRDALAAGLALAAIGPAAAKADGPTTKPPNIIFILADDMGYADLSCFGRREYTTPSLDRLAREGMRFTSAYSNSPDCSATRVALMTGRYQYRLPVGLAEPLAGPNLGLDPSLATLPSRLRKAGYSTALIGKWHLGELPKFGPLLSGYDHFWGFRRAGIDYFSHENLGGHDLWENDTEIYRTGYSTDLFGDQALVMLNRFAKNQRPFFLSLHFNAPHWPWEGPADQAESKRIAPPKDLTSFAHFDGGTLETYGEMVKRLDFQVGRVLKALRSLRLERDTIVIFTSDNGGERFSDTWPFSGRKNELLEGGLRVPTVMRWPGKIRPGSTSDTPIMTMDWMPTLLAAAGVSNDDYFLSDGLDIAPLLAGKSIQDRELFWRFRTNDQRALRLGRWKYLKIKENEFLFDVIDDPLERANLKARNMDRFTDLVNRWHRRNAEMLPVDTKPIMHRFDATYFPDR
jgi:arylsulfatase A-like enzyme